MNFRALLNHLLPAYFSLHRVLCNTFDIIRTKISYVIGQFSKIWVKKFKSCLFCLKIGTHDILEVLIPNQHLDFWNSDPKIHFWANLDQKSESCPFCLKVGLPSISRMNILVPTLVFWISNSKSIFGQIWAQKVKDVSFA